MGTCKKLNKYTEILVNMLFSFLPEELRFSLLLASAAAVMDGLQWGSRWRRELPGWGQSLNQESSRGGEHGQMVAVWTDQPQAVFDRSFEPTSPKYKSDYVWTEHFVLSCEQFTEGSGQQKAFKSLFLSQQIKSNSKLRLCTKKIILCFPGKQVTFKCQSYWSLKGIKCCV